MIRSKIRAYYEYSGPSKSDPFRNELTQEQVNDHLERFPSELEHALDGPGSSAKVEIEKTDTVNREITVLIESPLSTRDYDNALKRTLNGLDLFAEQLEFSEIDESQ